MQNNIPTVYISEIYCCIVKSTNLSTILQFWTGGKIVVADQIYCGRFLFASKNCENNKNTDFATLSLGVLQQRKSKRKLADVNFNKR
jgi:hypothetical protein